MGAASMLLLMVSLQVALLLVVAGASAAADSGGTIRLPSDARGAAADLVTTAMARAAKPKHQLAGGDKERPWGKCCDVAICTRSYPPLCQCLDQVERCNDACKECVQTEGSLHVCADIYLGDPGPRCHDDDGNGHNGLADADVGQAAAALAAVMADNNRNAGGGDDENGGDHEWARRLARGHRRF